MVVEGAVRSGAMNTAHWTTNLHGPSWGVHGPVSSVASTGVNQLIRLGSASAVANAQDVVTDVMTHAARAAGAGAELVDESFVPGPCGPSRGRFPRALHRPPLRVGDRLRGPCG